MFPSLTFSRPPSCLLALVLWRCLARIFFARISRARSRAHKKKSFSDEKAGRHFDSCSSMPNRGEDHCFERRKRGSWQGCHFPSQNGHQRKIGIFNLFLSKYGCFLYIVKKDLWIFCWLEFQHVNTVFFLCGPHNSRSWYSGFLAMRSLENGQKPRITRDKHNRRPKILWTEQI